MLSCGYPRTPSLNSKTEMTLPTLEPKASARLRITGSAVVLTLWAFISTPAWAHLGGDVASVAAATAALRAQVRTTPTVQYDLHEIVNDGLVIHEYSTRQGQVFAVTWQGPFKPDLRQLLGDYFASSQSAASQLRAGSHRVFAMARPDLLVESTGRLRGFRGLAYLPALVPSGFSLQQLR